jgi:hypothetical protein
MRWLALFLCLAGLTAPAPVLAGEIEERFHQTEKAGTATVAHTSWTKLLAKHVKPGADGLNRVDYAAFKSTDHAVLKAYLKDLQNVRVQPLGRAEQFAFWANLYNAATIDVVLDHYPVKSIKDIKLGGILSISGGPWSKKLLKVEGVELSLDDIEHNILRPHFKDPRVHYAVNCASIGCPNLRTEAFTGDQLDRQLDDAARAFVNHPRGVRIDGGRIIASKIYTWFQKDFGGTDKGVLAHVAKYAAGDLAQAVAKAKTISSYEYDWGLNDVAR